MASSNYQQVPFAPPMFPNPDDNIRPIPPVRHEFARNRQEEELIPTPPPRTDIIQDRKV